MKVSITDISFVLVLLFLLSYLKLSGANNTINTTESIRDNQTLVSSGGSFELGFFSPGNSSNWYVGIWYKNITPKTVVWVANRESPLKNRTSGVLKVNEQGLLVIADETTNIIWSSNNSGLAQNPIVQLLDSGNLVLRAANDGISGNYLWQSFEFPTDTVLPGMDFGLNSVTGRPNYASSWKTNRDPALGDFTAYMDPSGYPQVITKRGAVTLHRLGPWNGLTFSGAPDPINDPNFAFGLYKHKEGGFYYREGPIDQSVISRLTLNPSGNVQRWTWVSRTQEWAPYLNLSVDNCDNYKLCGAYGICNIVSSPACGCLDKFVPKDPDGWIKQDWSNGCIRRTEFNCSVGDGFLKYSNIKLPDARTSWYNESMTIEECKDECLKNCSCIAYTNLDIRRRSGCLLWFGELVDIRVLSAGGQDLYIRMASSELGSSQKRNEALIVSLTVVGVLLLGLSLLLFIWMRKKNDAKRRKNGRQDETHNEGLELPLFPLSTISKATDSFSSKNKLGEGGYGPVYKGTLEEGQEIAVKRLSKTSMQGFVEFKNEALSIAKHQHRNLVKLLGCCIEGEEKMLIYEYMPNKSLDLILFDEKRRMLLDWPKRFNIVNGIARGLMYLHQDSRLRIIHRDLKASNVLLDSEMNPKISDFGLAKRFKGNETEDMTSRVVGTYGYMSPEYAVYGQFSLKSDVFSFGVLMLEIVSGKRNSSFSHGDRHLNLLGYAWTLYNEGRSIEFIDTCVQDSASLGEVLRLIHVGLLCVQQFPDDRPNMSSVVSMLSNEAVLPQANHPGFFMESERNIPSYNPTSYTNEVTITMPIGR